MVKHHKVFVIAALWDYNYNHFLIDSLARLSRHMGFLRQHPDVMVHIRAFEEYEGNQEMHGAKAYRDNVLKMRNGLFNLLGISLSRVISGPVLAREVIIPRNIHCSNSISNPFEVR
jgi:hypothetical protein